MPTFPLYDNLSKDIPKKDLTVTQKEDFVKKVENINQAGQDLIYALVEYYRMEEDKDSDNKVVGYNGTKEEVGKNNTSITWTFTDFPIKLRHILYKFVILHTTSMKEEEVRQSNKESL
jgi:hypothetical protein